LNKKESRDAALAPCPENQNQPSELTGKIDGKNLTNWEKFAILTLSAL
jgi:hypothetical protein